jgi:hypothetical protein
MEARPRRRAEEEILGGNLVLARASMDLGRGSQPHVQAPFPLPTNPSANHVGPCTLEVVAMAAWELGHAASTPLPIRVCSMCVAPWLAAVATSLARDPWCRPCFAWEGGGAIGEEVFFAPSGLGVLVGIGPKGGCRYNSPLRALPPSEGDAAEGPPRRRAENIMAHATFANPATSTTCKYS